MSRPIYEALDRQGIPYLRPAEVVGELPHEARKNALIEATPSIAAKIGIEYVRPVNHGTPVFCAFENMTRNKAKQHPQAKLLLALGTDVSLDFCPSYCQ